MIRPSRTTSVCLMKRIFITLGDLIWQKKKKKFEWIKDSLALSQLNVCSWKKLLDLKNASLTTRKEIRLPKCGWMMRSQSKQSSLDSSPFALTCLRSCFLTVSAKKPQRSHWRDYHQELGVETSSIKFDQKPILFIKNTLKFLVTKCKNILFGSFIQI